MLGYPTVQRKSASTFGFGTKSITAFYSYLLILLWQIPFSLGGHCLAQNKSDFGTGQLERELENPKPTPTVNFQFDGTLTPFAAKLELQIKVSLCDPLDFQYNLASLVENPKFCSAMQLTDDQVRQIRHEHLQLVRQYYSPLRIVKVFLADTPLKQQLIESDLRQHQSLTPSQEIRFQSVRYQMEIQEKGLDIFLSAGLLENIDFSEEELRVIGIDHRTEWGDMTNAVMANQLAANRKLVQTLPIEKQKTFLKMWGSAARSFLLLEIQGRPAKNFNSESLGNYLARYLKMHAVQEELSCSRDQRITIRRLPSSDTALKPTLASIQNILDDQQYDQFLRLISIKLASAIGSVGELTSGLLAHRLEISDKQKLDLLLQAPVLSAELARKNSLAFYQMTDRSLQSLPEAKRKRVLQLIFNLPGELF